VIARVWRGWTSAEDADAYQAYVVETGMSESRSTPGNRGTYVLRRRDGDRVEFTTITLWDSLDAIVGFSGSRDDTAVFYPEDERFLVERELMVGHHELVHEDPPLGDQPD
jgi:heme-degrading monooxygenase HmoA